MAEIGQWLVGVKLQFTSNTSAEIKAINAALKGLREGEIKRVQKEFGNLSHSIAADMLAAQMATQKAATAMSAAERERQKLFSEGMARDQARAKGRAEAEAAASKVITDAEQRRQTLFSEGMARDMARAQGRAATEKAAAQVQIDAANAVQASEKSRQTLFAQGMARDMERARQRSEVERQAAQERIDAENRIQTMRQEGLARDLTRVTMRKDAELAASKAIADAEVHIQALRAAGLERDAERARARADAELAATRAITEAEQRRQKLFSEGMARDMERARQRSQVEREAAKAIAAAQARAIAPAAARRRLNPLGGVGGFAGGLLLPGMLAGGASAFILGMMAKQMIGGALGTAGEFQTSFQSSIGIGGLNAKQQGLAYETIASSVNRTGFSPLEEADIFKEILRLTTGTMSREQSIGMVPEVSALARVLQLTRGVNPKETTDASVEIMHLLRDYNPADTHRMMIRLLAMGEMMPQDLTKTVTQLKQYVPAFKNLGVSEDETMGLMVFLARAGLGTGRSGTAARSLDQGAFKPLTITSYMQAIKNKQLNDILGPGGGEQFYYQNKGAKTKTFHEIEFLDAIAKFGAAHPNEKPKVVTTLSNVFGQQGAVIANLLSDPQMVGYLDQTIKAMHTPTLTPDAFLDRYGSNLPQQMQRVKHNFDLLEIDLMKDLLPSIANTLRVIADAIFDLHQHIYQHPEAVKGIKEWFDSVTGAVSSLISTFKNDKHPFDKPFDNLGDQITDGLIRMIKRMRDDYVFFLLHGETRQDAAERLRRSQHPNEKHPNLGVDVYGRPNLDKGQQWFSKFIDVITGTTLFNEQLDRFNKWVKVNHLDGSNPMWGPGANRAPNEHTVSTTPGASSGANITTVKLEVHGNVYGMDDFNKKVSDSVKKAMEEAAKKAMHNQAANPNNTNAHVPQFQSASF
jgi:hypothetical protein